MVSFFSRHVTQKLTSCYISTEAFKDKLRSHVDSDKCPKELQTEGDKYAFKTVSFLNPVLHLDRSFYENGCPDLCIWWSEKDPLNVNVTSPGVDETYIFHQSHQHQSSYLSKQNPAYKTKWAWVKCDSKDTGVYSQEGEPSFLDDAAAEEAGQAHAQQSAPKVPLMVEENERHRKLFNKMLHKSRSDWRQGESSGRFSSAFQYRQKKI